MAASCRLGHETRHFNVGSYRRKQRGEDEIQNADLFDHKSKVRLHAVAWSRAGLLRCQRRCFVPAQLYSLPMGTCCLG